MQLFGPAASSDPRQVSAIFGRAPNGLGRPRPWPGGAEGIGCTWLQFVTCRDQDSWGWAILANARRRRLIYNDDADQQYRSSLQPYGYQISDEASFVDARTTPTFNTHVDTYVWCLGNGAEPPWGTPEFVPGITSSEHATELIIGACRSGGIEVWGSLRMNDVHDASRSDRLEQADDPVKAQHADWMLQPPESRMLPASHSERYLWTAFNFAVPAVREYRLAFVEKSASRHDFDAYELDFTRFTWYFPLGEERQCRHLMTDLVRRIRIALDSIGKSRGRPYELAVHVFDSIDLSLGLGLDVASWLAEGLVNALVVGMGYMFYDLELGEWLSLGAKYGALVYPSINTNTLENWLPVLRAPVYHEALRAAAAYYWHEGADGVYLFNHFCQRNWRNIERAGDVDVEYIYSQLLELGDPALLRGKNKLYAVQPDDELEMHRQAVGVQQLPLVLGSRERMLMLKLGPDATDQEANAKIRALVQGGVGATIWLRLNHKLMEARRVGEWVEAEVPAGILRPGDNVLSLWCDRELGTSADPPIVRRVFVPVQY